MPVAAYAARIMCSACGNAAGVPIAAIGSMSANLPSTSVKPVGVFIHALAMTTKTPEAAPLTATRMPATRCARGETLSHP